MFLGHLLIQNPTFWTILLCGATSINANASPIIDLSYARYQGTVDASTNITTFLGIRYAAAPTGDLRFRAPRPPQSVAALQQATEQPKQCFQAMGGASPTNPFRKRALESESAQVTLREVQVDTSEDCLFLSVYYPSDASGVPTSPLPVLISHIYSRRRYRYGLGASSQFRGTDLLKQSNRGLVIVIIQYRLGLFGFLSSEAVEKNGTLNTGLLDQDFALRWVNKHISKFGGDPSKVTIWGESAGAGSVLQHVVANNGQTKPQLFRGAITSSLFSQPQYHYNDHVPELVYGEVVAQTNCTAAADSMSCLRAVDATALGTVYQNISMSAFFGTWIFVPVVDGKFIARRPTLSLAQGKVNGKALLSVSNAFEGTIFVDQSTEATANATQYAADLFPELGPSQAENVGALYADLGTPLFQTNAIYGESILICPAYYMQRAFPGRSFKAEFAIPAGFHGRDLPYYFPSIGIDVPALDFPVFNNTAFIDAFAQTFTSFAISLDPNVKVSQTITPKWERWAQGRMEMRFNKTEGDGPDVRAVKTQDKLLERCKFWESVGRLTGQ
ncbi:Alpha/Beta hydrolase protein [Mycena crocata]|nr:Alpha/Beta hydrolase protein [Mycena crocata]